VEYRDNGGGRRTPWTHPCNRPQTMHETKNMVVTVEGVNDIEAGAVKAAMEELVSLVREHRGGEVSWCTVDRDRPWALLGDAPRPGQLGLIGSGSRGAAVCGRASNSQRCWKPPR